MNITNSHSLKVQFSRICHKISNLSIFQFNHYNRLWRELEDVATLQKFDFTQFIISFTTTERIIPLLPVYRSSRKLDHRRSPGHRGGQTAPKTAGSGNFSDVLWVTDVSARTQTGEQTRGPHAGEQEHGHLRFESPPLVGHTDLHRLPTLACSSGTSSDFAIYIYSQDPCWIYITVCSWLSNRADRERKQHLDPPCSLESV